LAGLNSSGKIPFTIFKSRGGIIFTIGLVWLYLIKPNPKNKRKEVRENGRRKENKVYGPS
jgi:hypothetical protein